MIYSFQLFPHTNIRYRQAQDQLAFKELICLLRSIGIETLPRSEQLGGSTFIHVEAEHLNSDELQMLASHSLVMMIWQQENGRFLPLPVSRPRVFPEDLSEVLKYKGKTNPAFTRMMINCAMAAAHLLGQRVTVLDPMAGRGTTLMCALEAGHDALGIEARSSEVREFDTYMGRYCAYHHFKHERTAASRTVRGRGVPVISYRLAPSREDWKEGRVSTAVIASADTSLAPELFRREKPDVLVADLPYGVQHAPSADGEIASFSAFLSKALPAWHSCLRSGGALAMSFNTFTLKKSDVVTALCDAGFIPLTEEPYASFEHEVEQAVKRDFVTALASAQAGSKEVSH